MATAKFIQNVLEQWVRNTGIPLDAINDIWNASLRSWRDLARESFCFGSEAVKESGEAVRGLVKIPRGLRPRVKLADPPPLARSRIPPATQATKTQSYSLTWINYKSKKKQEIIASHSQIAVRI